MELKSGKLEACVNHASGGQGLPPPLAGSRSSGKNHLFNNMYQVYILKSEKLEKYYIGHSHDIVLRLESHNHGKVRSTKAYRPWKIVYSEISESKQEAYKREFQIKSYKGGEAFKKLLEK